MSVTQIIGPRIKPMWADPVEWTSTRAYDADTYVTYQGDSYASRQPTPIGIQITNNDYWVKISEFNAQAVAMQNSVNQTLEANETAMQNMLTQGTQDITAIKNEAESSMNDSVAHVDSVAASLQSSVNQIETNKQNISRYYPKEYYRKRLSNLCCVGHRGAPMCAPEDTLASYRCAHALMYEVVETDAYMTTDNVVVCAHDNTLSSYFDSTANITDSKYSDFKDTVIYKTNTYFFPNETIPTLVDVLDYIRVSGMFILVEIKDDAHWQQICDIVNRYTDCACVMSWSLPEIRQIRSMYGNLPVIYLRGTLDHAYIDAAAEAGCLGVHSGTNFDQNLIDYVHSKNMLFGAWESPGKAFNYGADFINIDDPIVANVEYGAEPHSYRGTVHSVPYRHPYLKYCLEHGLLTTYQNFTRYKDDVIFGQYNWTPSAFMSSPIPVGNKFIYSTCIEKPFDFEFHGQLKCIANDGNIKQTRTSFGCDPITEKGFLHNVNTNDSQYANMPQFYTYSIGSMNLEYTQDIHHKTGSMRTNTWCVYLANKYIRCVDRGKPGNISHIFALPNHGYEATYKPASTTIRMGYTLELYDAQFERIGSVDLSADGNTVTIPDNARFCIMLFPDPGATLQQMRDFFNDQQLMW